MKKQRNVNVDIIRCTAVFSVISVHFFLNNGFYQEVVQGKRMYAMVLMRTAFMVCVPLFMMLTGYLMCGKELSVKYYRGIKKTLWIYVMASVACLLFKVFYRKQEISLFQGLLGILNFTAADYSWYVEMYVGLFLLIPFLNILFRGLETKRRKQYLILTLLVCTTLPSLLNIWDFATSGFWETPVISKKWNALVPDWWTGIYPLTYYFLGAYLREYKVKLSTGKNLLLLLFAVIAFGSFNYYRSYTGNFKSGSFVSWEGFENVIDTVLVFILLLNINTERIPLFFKRFFAVIADLALGIYLVSYILDQICYPVLLEKVPVMPQRLEWYAVIVPVVFVGSSLLSLVLNGIYSLGEKGISSMRAKGSVE